MRVDVISVVAEFMVDAARVKPGHSCAPSAFLSGAPPLTFCHYNLHRTTVTCIVPLQVVQIYAKPSTAVAAKAASPPKLVLLGFARTDVLQPGDTLTTCIPVDLADLRLMGVDGAFKVRP
jgi:hypothetical protein